MDESELEWLVQESGPGAQPLAQLLPGLRRVLPIIPLTASLSAEEEHFRVNDAGSQFLLAVSRRQPLLLVLDDLHWADRSSLALLQHLGRVLGQRRLLIVAAFRDGEIEAQHPLTGALAKLRREPGYERLKLQGLDRFDLGAYVTALSRTPISEAPVDTLHLETGGNPFFVGEILRYLVEEGPGEEARGLTGR